MPKNKKVKNIAFKTYPSIRLGQILIITILSLLPLLLLRFPQIKALLHIFEAEGRINDAQMAISSYLLRELAVVFTSLGTGYFVYTRKRIHLPLLYTCYILEAYLLYRIISDCIIFTFIHFS